MSREPIVWVEIDVDQCTLSYGVGGCSAVLGDTGDRKCFNTYKTCQAKSDYDLGSLTYKFFLPQDKLPREAGVFPCLQSVSESSGEVNIAGANTDVVGIGKRERVTFTCVDFPYGDSYTDKYFRERKTGEAQSSGVGYDPADRGTFFGKLRARWPYYSGRSARICEGFYENGVLTDVIERHFILTDMDIDVSNDTVSFEAKDILALANDDSATVPIANSGELLNDIGEDDLEIELSPEGVGDDEYEASGRINIGDEILSFDRSGDILTITGRGLSGTEISSHSAGDNVQQTFYVDDVRFDRVVRNIIRDYADVPSEFIPFSDWVDEADRWSSSLRLSFEIVEPTGCNTVLSSMCQLGFSIWWNRQTQKVGLKVNRPPDEDNIFTFSDDKNIKSISIDDRDDERLTQIGIYTGLRDPISDHDSADSYTRLRQIVDVDSESEFEFNDSKIRKIMIPWLGDGSSNSTRIIGKRLLNRFKWSPSFYTMTVTYDPDIELTDVIRVNSRIHQDETGANSDKLMQAVSIKYDKPKHEMTVTAQTYQYDQRYGLIAPNDVPDYNSATDEQKEAYIFLVDDTTELLPDGSEPCVII